MSFQNLAYYLNAEQRKMVDLWEELQRVRRQFADYKEQTERDLENQKNEVAKVTRSVGGVSGRLSATSHGVSSCLYVGHLGKIIAYHISRCINNLHNTQAKVPIQSGKMSYEILIK